MQERTVIDFDAERFLEYNSDVNSPVNVIKRHKSSVRGILPERLQHRRHLKTSLSQYSFDYDDGIVLSSKNKCVPVHNKRSNDDDQLESPPPPPPPERWLFKFARRLQPFVATNTDNDVVALEPIKSVKSVGSVTNSCSNNPEP